MKVKLSRRTVRELARLAGKVKAESCSWRLVRYVGTRRGGYYDAQSWTGADMDLFGMLAMMVLHRDHAQGGRGMFELVCYASRRIVAARVRVR